MSTFTPTGATGGAFNCTAGTYAIGRSTVTTASASDQVSLKFTTTRRPLWFRVGSAAGDQDIINDTLFLPGDHVFSFVPGFGTYYIEFQLREVGDAVLSGLARVAPGLLTLPTPYAVTDYPSLRSEQSLDVQWLCDGVHAPRRLERRGVNSWSLRLFSPPDGPFEASEFGDVNMTPSARLGTVTITASGPAFITQDAGSLIKLTQSGQYETANGVAISNTTDSIKVSGSGVSRTFTYSVTGTFSATWQLERSVGNELSWQLVTSGTGTVTTTLSDGLDGQIVYYRIRISAYTSGTAVMELVYSGGVTEGVARIFSVNADNAVTADVLEPFASTDPTGDWARGSWSDRFGWPATVALFEGRLMMRRDNLRWQSAPELFENFPDGAEDNDGIAGSVPGRMNLARWDKACERLMIGNSGGEGYVSSGNFDEVMTPVNTRARVRTEDGSINADAVLVAGAPAFIHRAGRRINQMVFDGDAYTLLNLSRLHRDIAGVNSGSFVELAYQNEPEPRLMAVRDDGELAVMLIDLQERIGAWARIVPTGTLAAIESICVNPGTPEDHVYRAVSRVIGGVTKRYVEKVASEAWSESQLAWRLECAESYTGPATSTLSGLDHLIGQEVWCWGNGRKTGPYTVNGSGEITLPYEVTYAIAGLLYTGKYEGPRQPPLIEYKKPDRLGFITYNTMGGSLGVGRSFDQALAPLTGRRQGWNYLPDRPTTGTYDTPTVIYSDDWEIPFDGSRERDARICIEFTGVGPTTLLAIVPRLNK